MRLTLSRKLGVSIVSLLGLVIISGILSIIQINLIYKDMKHVADVEEPICRAICEMEISANEIGLATLEYLHNPAFEYIEQISKNIKNFEDFYNRYERLIHSEKARQNGVKVLKKFDQYNKLTGKLIGFKDEQMEKLELILRDIEIFDELMEENNQQAVHLKSAQDLEKLVLALKIKNESNELALSLQKYLRTGSAEYLDGIQDDLKDFESYYSPFKKLLHSSSERQRIKDMEGLFKDKSQLVKELIDLEDNKREGLAAFMGLRKEFGHEHDDLFQSNMHKSLREAHTHTNGTVRRAGGYIGLTILACIVTGAFIGAAFKKSITDPVDRLVAFSEGIGNGDFERRVNIRPGDEFGTLGTAFNQMADRLMLKVDQLQRNKRVLQAIFDGISDPLMVIDENMETKRFNRAAAAYYQGSPHDDVVTKFCFRGFRKPNDDCVRCKIMNAVLTHEYQSFEQKSPIYQGRIEKITVYPIAEDGEGTAIVRISDITEERKMEQELIQADKMISLGILVSGVAHEINNPNNFIMLNTPLLMEAWESAVPILEAYCEEKGEFSVGGLPFSEMREEIPGLFNGLEEGSKRIQRIVQDLKDYSRREDADMDHSVDINEVIESAKRLLNNLVKKSTKRFRLDLDKDLPLIKVNRQRIEQVIINLIQNACQAITDKEEEISVSSKYDAARDGIVVEVSDEGVGIPEEELPQIMDPFFTTKRHEGGTGLGLSVSANIVNKHGGNIHVHSERGKGTILTVFLPLHKRDNTAKILVVDDDDQVRSSLSTLLKRQGYYQVDEASNGKEASLKLIQDPPDVLLLDIILPDMSGAQICRLIKGDPALSQMKVVLLTGHPDSNEIIKINDLGFRDILIKPFGALDIMTAIKRPLNQASQL